MVTQRWPTAWLLTDERLGEALADAMARAATAGAGVLVRHHHSGMVERRRVAQLALALGAPLGLARDVHLARELGATFVHNPECDPAGLAFSMSVHDEGQASRAGERGADLVFISPIYPTRSHPRAASLGEAAALSLMRIAGCPAIALGGVDQLRGARLMEQGFSGWAGIDCWLRT